MEEGTSNLTHDDEDATYLTDYENDSQLSTDEMEMNREMSQTPVNVSGIEKRIDNLSSAISSLSRDTDKIKSKVDGMDSTLSEVKEELHSLSVEFQKMVEDQRKTANLQRAISELVRVRQEINQKYGNYTTIRHTMLGVLQATDLAIVKKSTISKVSEELMISTPDYWLAPCLVAIAAWISNDRELAERAITEALKRDEEKTALAMALICRRNGRVQTGYEWLSLYFAKQSATSFTEDSFTYVDAYVNGVFGPDEKHMCQGYVAKWIDEVRGNSSNFESSQEAKWKEFCSRFSRNTDSIYPDLAEAVPEYGRISACVGRIKSMPDIQKEFKGITDAFVDTEAMKKAIDAELVRLIGNYDETEMDIRKEEEYLALVKYFAGDEDKAKEEMNAREAKRLRHKLDFIEQMSNTIISGQDTSPSKKRTAVAFLSSYINRGAAKYIDEKKSEFPSDVTIKVDKWSGKSTDGTEYKQLSDDYRKQMTDACNNAIHYARNTKPKLMLIFSIILFVLAAFLGIASLTSGLHFIFPVATLVGAIAMLLTRLKAKNDIEREVVRINEEYKQRIKEGEQKLQRVLEQWSDAKKTVANFDDALETKVA